MEVELYYFKHFKLKDNQFIDDSGNPITIDQLVEVDHYVFGDEGFIAVEFPKPKEAIDRELKRLAGLVAHNFLGKPSLRDLPDCPDLMNELSARCKLLVEQTIYEYQINGLINPEVANERT